VVNGVISENYTPSTPEFEEQELGVILEVTPTVDVNGYVIDLELRPQVVEFIRYDDSFGFTTIQDGVEVENKWLMPILSERSVETKVIVWDGETVVLGGMIKEEISTFDDRVPVLGDIPGIGRLFRSSGQSTQKTNLLIFVTARIVDPSGIPVRATELRGLPDFRR
jgi:general secretion pathway protein D